MFGILHAVMVAYVIAGRRRKLCIEVYVCCQASYATVARRMMMAVNLNKGKRTTGFDLLLGCGLNRVELRRYKLSFVLYKHQLGNICQ